MVYGFQDTERWYHCYGEVFKIYARGKGIGDAIEEHDHVSLFHIQEQRWLSMHDHIARLGSCPGLIRPRCIENYDYCPRTTFEIWSRQPEHKILIAEPIILIAEPV